MHSWPWFPPMDLGAVPDRRIVALDATLASPLASLAAATVVSGSAPSNPSFRCYESNPDVAGIGVRFAIYIQAFLAILSLFIYTCDAHFTTIERLSAFRRFSPIMATACALLVSAMAQMYSQQDPGGFDYYHVTIILYLSWINILTFTMLTTVISLHGDQSQTGLFASPLASVRRLLRLRDIPWLTAGVIRLHLMAVGMIGTSMWFYSSRPPFDKIYHNETVTFREEEVRQCRANFEIVIFGQTVTSSTLLLRQVYNTTNSPFI